MQKNYLTMALAAIAVIAPASASAAAPMPPSNVVATETPDGIVLTWTAVNENQDEEYVDPSEVVYDVFRINAATDESTAVAQDIAATTCTDPLTGITGDNVFKWQVIAKTDGGSSSSYEGYSNEVFLGKDFNHVRNYSESVASQIDEEIERIVKDAYSRTKEILSEHIDKLHAVAQALLKEEKIDGKEFEAIMKGEQQPAEAEPQPETAPEAAE